MGPQHTWQYDRGDVGWQVSIIALLEHCTYRQQYKGTITFSSLMTYIYIYIYIQSDSGRICTTLGNDSMSDSKQKSSYEHGSDFERLRSYGHFLIPVHALMWNASYGWCTLLGGFSFALQALLLPADSPTRLQTVQFPYLDTWGIRGRWGGYSPSYKLIVMQQQGTVVIVWGVQ